MTTKRQIEIEKDWEKPYAITSLYKDDVKMVLEDRFGLKDGTNIAGGLTKDQMNDIAECLSDALCESNVYWDVIEEWLSNNIKRL